MRALPIVFAFAVFLAACGSDSPSSTSMEDELGDAQAASAR